jgi:HlyD family secretion protein
MNAHCRRTAATLAIALSASLLLVLADCKKPGGKGTGAGGNFVPAKMMELPAQIVATGTVAPQVGAEVPVGPRVSGTLKKLYVQIGDVVKKGQVLGVLDDRDLAANVDSATASLAAAKAASVYAQANYERLKELLPKGYVSQDAVDVARQNMDSAAANVKKTQAQLDYARIQHSYATVSAPIDGVVESVATQEGSTVAASFNAPTFVTLIDLGRLEVDAYVDEVDIGGVKVGQKASFAVDAFTDKVFHGVVQAIRPQAIIQDNVVNYAVILTITDPFENMLRPQMTASVTINMDSLKGALVIPAKAVKHEGGKAFVTVPSPGGKGTVQRPVTLGKESGDFVQVKAGLSMGDKVLVAGGSNQSPGM